jgi:PilZ domain-containing protein
MKTLPPLNTLVLVRVGEPEQVLRSRVEEVSDGFVSIAYPSDGETEHQLPVSTQVTLEWLVERGLCTATGAVFSFVTAGPPALNIKLDAEPIVFQRREHARAELVLELDVYLADPDAPPVSGVTLDVSGGGLRAVMSETFALNSLVRVSVDLPDGRPVEALARVVAQRDDGVVAFAFDDIVADDRERLIRAVFTSYRATAMVRRPH